MIFASYTHFELLQPFFQRWLLTFEVGINRMVYLRLHVWYSTSWKRNTIYSAMCFDCITAIKTLNCHWSFGVWFVHAAYESITKRQVALAETQPALQVTLEDMAYYVWPCFASGGKVGWGAGSDAKIRHLVIKVRWSNIQLVIEGCHMCCSV